MSTIRPRTSILLLTLLLLSPLLSAPATADPGSTNIASTAPVSSAVAPAAPGSSAVAPAAPGSSAVAPAAPGSSPYLVGSGIYDITGPPAGVMMQGYVDFSQTTHGILNRLRSRAFVVADPASGSRVALVSIDQVHVYQVVTRQVVERLRATFGDLYTDRNVLIQATHTHSAPGGFSNYLLYTVSTLGFSQQNLDAVVEGVYQSIVRAHWNLAPGSIRIAKGDLVDGNVNRSPEAYALDPEAERARYAYDVDKEMTLLRFVRADGTSIGSIAWYPVHATSLQRDNRLISGDNKGYASYLLEKAHGTRYDASDTFVASFPNSNAGDASPSAGADLNGDGNWDCPLVESIRCMELAGRKQYEKARALFDTASEPLEGPVDFRHSYVDFSKITVSSRFTGAESQHTCYAAIGISMLAGAKDGKGIGREGVSCSHPSMIGRLLCLRNRCHGEKPVAIDLGRKWPHPWTPEVLPVQVIRIGQLALAAVPAEFTTMSGRRVRETILDVLRPAGVRYAVLAGYANAYAGYVATREEYARQNYEGASTHFGEWTLAAYQQELYALALAMREDREVPEGPTPRDLSRAQLLHTPRQHGRDRLPHGRRFGDIEIDAQSAYRPSETVRVTFWGGWPDNDLMTQRSYLEVQRETSAGWQAIAWDWDEETKLIWEPKGRKSRISVEWAIPDGTPAGRYRILHRGVWKDSRGRLTPYEGLSRAFEVGERTVISGGTPPG